MNQDLDTERKTGSSSTRHKNGPETKRNGAILYKPHHRNTPGGREKKKSRVLVHRGFLYGFLIQLGQGRT